MIISYGSCWPKARQTESIISDRKCVFEKRWKREIYVLWLCFFLYFHSWNEIKKDFNFLLTLIQYKVTYYTQFCSILSHAIHSFTFILDSISINCWIRFYLFIREIFKKERREPDNRSTSSWNRCCTETELSLQPEKIHMCFGLVILLRYLIFFIFISSFYQLSVFWFH